MFAIDRPMQVGPVRSRHGLLWREQLHGRLGVASSSASIVVKPIDTSA